MCQWVSSGSEKCLLDLAVPDCNIIIVHGDLNFTGGALVTMHGSLCVKDQEVNSESVAD